MDQKADEMIKKIYNMLKDNVFLETDILNFLILIREHLAKTSTLREICDFIAHRERDRGNTFNYLKKIKKYVDENSVLPKNLSASLYKEYEIKRELNDFLITRGFDPLNDKTLREIILCIISLLQETKLVNDNVDFGKLYITIFPYSIGIYTDLNVANYFSVNTLDGKSENVYLAVPIIVMLIKPLIINWNPYTSPGKPISLQRQSNELYIKIR